MTSGALVIRAFFGYQIDSRYHRPSSFRLLGRVLNKEMRHKCRVILEYGEFPPGTQLWEQVRSTISRADVVVIDISENNPNVLLEAGLAYGMGKLVVLLRSRKTDARLPADLQSFLHIPYEEFDAVVLARALKRGIESYLKEPRDGALYLRHLWGLDPTSRTYVLPGRVPEEYGRNPLEDYLRLREYTDLDAVFLITETLTRLYPHMSVLVHQSATTRDLPDDWRESNVVCVGGPDFNPIVREFDRHCPLGYRYEGDSVWLVDKATGKSFVPMFRDRGGLRRVEDYGFLFKCRHGRRHDRKIIIIGGARTWGVYGATMLASCKGLLGESSGAMNARRIVQKLGSDPSFIARILVRGSVTGIEAPSLRMRDVTSLRSV